MMLVSSLASGVWSQCFFCSKEEEALEISSSDKPFDRKMSRMYWGNG
jgi:hypothetical protein